MSRYTSASGSDRASMLAAIGVESVDALFDVIPPGLRLKQPLALPGGLSEAEVYREIAALAARNVSTEDQLCFLGAGMYDHYVPAIVDALQQRAEFLTPYTPYQPEASQGTLQVMFEFQTAISELTALPIANSTVYDGPSAVGAAAYLAKLTGEGRRILVSRGLHPHSRHVLQTLSAGFGTEVEEIGLRDGATDADALAASVRSDTDVCAVVVQQPNFLGTVEDVGRLAAGAGSAPLVCACDPITLGVLRAPGESGAAIAVGEGQPLGGHLSFGGPSFGFLCAQERFLRKMPGRIAGETIDLDGRRAFVLTLQTREQHIRREKATSNITTAQTLNALGAMIYLSWLGRAGLVELGELLVQRTAHARDLLSSIDGVTPLHDQPVVREFAVRLEAPVEAVLARCRADGINPGYPLGRTYPEYHDGLLVAVTEQRTVADLHRLADVLAEAVRRQRRRIAA